MASNHFRETYDHNIAKHASFCRPCNSGCTCTESSNTCDKCEINDGTWYQDLIDFKCKPCRMIDDETNNFYYCKTCAWDLDLK